MKICLLITNLFRDFKFSTNNNKTFFNYDNNDYDIICVLFEKDNIEKKKFLIRKYFGNRVKLLINIFDNENQKKIF